MKKVLFLGGAPSQVPAIKYMKKLGWQILLCDNIIDNKGKDFADTFYLKSIFDYDFLIDLGKKERVDYVMGYASDPATLAASYVSEKLGLISNSYNSIEILCRKDKFRILQNKLGLNHPEFEINPTYEKIKGLKLPVIIKPVDSSDSKGVFVIKNENEIEKLIEETLLHSRSKNYIVEDFISNYQSKLHGDGLIENGKITFLMLGEAWYNAKSNPIKPICTVFPEKKFLNNYEIIKVQIEKVLRGAKFSTGTFNVDLIIDDQGNPFVIEIGPRAGGNYTPEVIKIATGIDLVSAFFNCIQGQPNFFEYDSNSIMPTMSFDLHKNESGVFLGLQLPNWLKQKIKLLELFINPGEKIKSFIEPRSTIGNIVLQFEHYDEMVNNKIKIYEDLYQAVIISL